MQLWIACYDITSARRLRRVAIALEQHGDRLQRSVFECGFDRENAALNMRRVAAYCDSGQDKLLMVPICRACRARMVYQGTGPPVNAEPYWLV